MADTNYANDTTGTQTADSSQTTAQPSAPPASPPQQTGGQDVPPPSMSDVLAGQPPQAPPDLGQANPQMPTQPRLWERVLRGALTGFLEQGVPGAIGGALDPTRAAQIKDNQQAQEQAHIKFVNAQAADAAASASMQDLKLHALPQQIQDEHNTNAADTVKKYSEVFGPPTLVIPNSGDHAMAAMQQQTADNGGVGHNLYVVSGQNIYAWDVNKSAAADQTWKLVAQAGKASGNEKMAGMTQAGWAALPKAMQTQFLENSKKIFDPVVPAKTAREQTGQISGLQVQLAKIQALPDGDPDKKELLTQTQNNLKLVQNAKTLGDQGDVDEAAKKAAAEQHAKGKDMEQLLNYGRDANGNKLDLNSATDEMWVDEKTGKPIPLKMVSQFKPSQNERARADFAKSSLHILATLDDLKAQGKLPNGPLQGLTKQKLASAGLGDQSAQRAIDDISLLQSATTGAHVGGKFSNEIMAKMKDLININMNDAQFQGAEDAIRDVMSGYVKSGGHLSVAEYKAMQNEGTAPTSGKTAGTPNLDLINKHKQGQ